ncbi:MAG: 30S ribosomal protein S4 [Nanoarchaeota archaeon]|jgi:small subunit ribosomal protein S4|nr:30S ribosomal protein S4 [Nanoarchaeota archaeon]
MKRKHKSFSRPKRPFDKVRIDEEVIIKKEFGLKNKTEIWKADEKVRSIRQKAKRSITAPIEEQKALYAKMRKIGLNVNTIGEILSLDKNDYLNRRLQTIVAAKGIAPTVRTARQMITHKRIMINGNVIDSPSYIVSVDLEDKITLKEKTKKVETPAPEATEDTQ